MKCENCGHSKSRHPNGPCNKVRQTRSSFEDCPCETFVEWHDGPHEVARQPTPHEIAAANPLLPKDPAKPTCEVCGGPCAGAILGVWCCVCGRGSA